MRRHTTIHRKRKEKRRKEHKRLGVFFGIGILCVCSIIGLLAWGSHHNAVSIRSVKVEGMKTIDENSVIGIVEKELEGNNWLIWNRANILWYPENDTITQILEVSPRIENVSIHRDGLTAIVVVVTERVPAYLWCEESYIDRERDRALIGEDYIPTCYFVDSKGFIFDGAPLFSGSTFFVWYGGGMDGEIIGEYIVAGDVFENAVSVVNRVKESGLNPTQHEFREGDGYLFFEDDTYLTYPLDIDPDTLGTDVMAVLKSLEGNTDWEYLDMRFGNKVFFQEKGTEVE